ncbi:MAG: FlgO family outer membrane protein [Candidatus Poribacteria bacterium]|nr:FlgO family outer membrane protein [Candidatus Poribacteria bacterium]
MVVGGVTNAHTAARSDYIEEAFAASLRTALNESGHFVVQTSGGADYEIMTTLSGSNIAMRADVEFVRIAEGRKVVERSFAAHGVAAVRPLVRQLMPRILDAYPLWGTVVEATDENILVNLGEENGISVGNMLVIAKGTVPIATLEVLEVRPTECVARVARQKAPVGAGMRARTWEDLDTAQSQPGSESLIAILPFENLGDAPEFAWIGSSIQESLTTELQSLSSYRLVERGQLRRVVNEQQLQASPLFNPNTAVETGTLWNVRFLVMGGYRQAGDIYYLNARRIDAQTGEVMETADIAGRDLFQLQKDLGRRLRAELDPTEHPNSEEVEHELEADRPAGEIAATDENAKPSADPVVYALVAGVDDYVHVADLANPVADATAIERELRETYRCSTELITNPTREEFLDSLYALADRDYGIHDQVIVFFAGHGWFDDRTKRGYLALSDSRRLSDDPYRDSLVPHEEIRTILERLDSRHVALIVDACFSGTLDASVALGGHRGLDPIYSDAGRAEYVGRKLAHRTRYYITSGGAEYVPDGRPGQHSPFARSFLFALRSLGGADGILTLEEILMELEKVRPQPKGGELYGHEPGGSIALISRHLEEAIPVLMLPPQKPSDPRDPLELNSLE